LGSKGGGGGGSGSNSFGFSSGTSTFTPNPQAMAAFQQSLGLAQNAVSRPYEPYQGQMVAGFTPDQMAAMQGVRNTQGIAQPYINTATNLTGQAVDYSNPANFNQYSLNQYMNPYQQSVVDATMKQLAQTQAQAEQQAQGRSALQGTFGGSGQYLGRAEVARQQGLAQAQTLAQLNAQNYQQAQNQYNQQQQQAIQTAQNAAYGLGQLGNMAQATSLTGINSLLQSGSLQQQLAQQQLTGAYNQWLQAKAYPYQQAAFYSGIASGIGPSMGGTTTYSGINMGQQQQMGGGGGGGGGGGAGAISSVMSMLPAMFSDEDEKTDKKKLGKDPETGLDMYAYRYKGDPKSYPKVVGPMAQDVEEKYPGFVYDIGGKKVVSDGERFMPREGRATGGSSAGSASTGSTGSTASTSTAARSSNASATAPTDVYAAPSMSYESAAPMAGSSQAMASEAIDPGTAQFLKGFLDPQTANEIARAKWVSKGTETRTAPEDSFGYFSNLANYAEGGRVEYAHGGGNAGGPWGELPAQVNPSPLSGLGPVGQLPLATGKDTPGSLGDMNKGSKLMFGANPIDSPMGSFALAAVPSASMAPSNLPAEAEKLAKAATPPKAASTEHFSKQGAEMAKSQAASAVPKGGGGGGSSGGGGGGMPKMPSMKGHGSQAAISKQASGNQSGIPSENTPNTATQSPEDQKEQTQPTPESQDAKIPESNQPMAEGAPPEAAGAEGGGEGFGGMEGGAEAAVPEAPAPEAPAPEMGGGDMGGGMGGFQDLFSGFGGFFADGGRIHKDGGGLIPMGNDAFGRPMPDFDMEHALLMGPTVLDAERKRRRGFDGGGAAGAGGPGSASGFGPTGDLGEITPSGLAEAGGVGPSSLLGQPGAGLGQLTLGVGNKPSDLAGFGKLKAGQEQRTGNDLTQGWMQQYRDEYKGGPQKTPKEQGMPDMPDADYYKTPLNISDISIGSNGTPNPGGISYTPIMTGMKGSGIGLFPTFNPPTNGSDYNDTSKMFQAPKTNGKVQGYYTGLGSQQVNPDSGLFNIDYLAPYYGGFYKDGGRVGMKDGGTPKLSTMDLIKILTKQGATPQEAIMLSSIAHPESGMNPYAHNPNARTGDNSYGLFQINMLGGMGPERLKKFGLKSANDLYDPNTNARVALQMLRERGSPKDWTTWTSGKNKPFLSQSKEAMAEYLNNPNIRNAPVNFEFNKDLPAMAQKGAYGYIAPSERVASSGSGQLPLSQDSEQHGFLMDILNGIFGDKGLLGGIANEIFGPEQAAAAPSAARTAPASRETAPVSRDEASATAQPAAADFAHVYTPPAPTAPAGSTLGQLNPDDPSGPLKPVETQETPSVGFSTMQPAEPGSRFDVLQKLQNAPQPDRRAEAEEASQTFSALEAPPSDSNETPDQGAEQAAKKGGRIRKKYATDGEVKKDAPEEKEPKAQSGEVTYDVPKFVAPSSLQQSQPSQEGFGGLFGDQGGQDFYTRWKTNPLSQLLYHLGQGAMAHPNASVGEALLAGVPHAMQGFASAMQDQRALAAEQAKKQHAIDFALGLNRAANEAVQERAHGGMVRHGYATDGAVEGDFLSDLGNMFGGAEQASPAPSAAPAQEQGGLFDGIFGGAEEPVAATQRAPRAVAQVPQEAGFFDQIFGGPEPQAAAPQPQQERGFLEDVFGGPEQEAAPQRQAARPVATDRQSRGLMDDIFGWDQEEPRAAPAKAPIVATDEKPEAPATAPRTAPVSEGQPPVAPAEGTKPTEPKTEAPVSTGPAEFAGPLYQHPMLKAYDKQINAARNYPVVTREDVLARDKFVADLERQKKNTFDQLKDDRDFREKQEAKKATQLAAEEKAKAKAQADTPAMGRARTQGSKEIEKEKDITEVAKGTMGVAKKYADALNVIQSGGWTEKKLALLAETPSFMRSPEDEKLVDAYNIINKTGPEALAAYVKQFPGQVRVAEFTIAKQGLPSLKNNPEANKVIIAQMMGKSQRQQDRYEHLNKLLEKNPSPMANEVQSYMEKWDKDPKHSPEHYEHEIKKHLGIKGSKPEVVEPSQVKELEQMGIKGAKSYGMPKEANAPKAEGAPPALEAGHEEGGYRFKGGNPADQSSWEKI
jgi:hypothetical protein